jgi:hypothetical protein
MLYGVIDEQYDIDDRIYSSYSAEKYTGNKENIAVISQ